MSPQGGRGGEAGGDMESRDSDTGPIELTGDGGRDDGGGGDRGGDRGGDGGEDGGEDGGVGGNGERRVRRQSGRSFKGFKGGPTEWKDVFLCLNEDPSQVRRSDEVKKRTK